MKVVFFLLAVGSLTVTASVKGQNTVVTLRLSQVTVEQAIQELEQKLSKDFFFEKGTADMNRLIDVDLVNAGLDEIVKKIFGKQYAYTLIDNMIVIIPQQQAQKEEKIIQGTVRNAKGEVMPGVAITIKGTTLGIATDVNGHFKLSLPDITQPVLVFSFIGMQKKEVAWKGEKVLNIVMHVDVQQMEEVMVTGYQTLPKERVTGAFTYISEKKLEQTASFSLKDKIEGLVPGLYFEPNFDEDQHPTSDRSRSIVIRGVSTFGNNNPLIVVDGFPVSDVSDPWENINPDDVGSITVLKDAAAASIWGAQAANGVIVITTKNGTGDKPSLNLSVDFMAKPVPDLSKIPWASSKEAMEIYKWMILEKDYLDDLLEEENYRQHDLSDVVRTLIDMKRGVLPGPEGNARLEELSKLDVRDEFKKLFFRPMETATKVNLSFQSNTANNNIRTSLTAVLNNQYSKGNSDFNIMVNLNDQYKPKPWLKFAFGSYAVFTQKKNNGVSVSSLQGLQQMSRILDDRGEYVYARSHVQDTAAKYNLPYDWNWNLKREADNADNTDKNLDLRMNGKLNILPAPWLNLELSYQYQYLNNYHREYFNEETWTVRNTVNDNARPDGTLPVPKGGMLYETKGYGYSHDVRAQFVFDKSIDRHTLRLMGGMEIRKDYYDETPYGYYGYDPQALTFNTNLNFRDPVFPKMSGNYDYSAINYVPSRSWLNFVGRDDRYMSYYGNGGYTFDSRYDLTGSIRLDKTNLYGDASDGNLPQWSVGLGWNITEEDFFQQAGKYIDYLKFRFSYGWNGNIDKSASPYIYGYAWTDPVSQLPYSAVQTAPNPALTWEKTGTYNIGIDYAILSDRINGSFNYYVKRTKNVLAQMAVNGTYGFQNNRATLNAGQINNQGVEFDLSALVIDKEIKWHTVFNYSFNKNMAKKITIVSNNLAAYTNMAFYYHKPDQPVSYIAAIRWAGYDETGMPRFRYGDEVLSVAEAESNYSKLEPEKLFEFVGQRDPKHFGAWTNTVSWKGLEFSVRLLYRFGHKFLKDYPAANMSTNYMSSNQNFTFLPKLMVNRWRSPADAETASMYSLEEKRTSSTLLDCVARYNTENVLNAGSIRLQNISLAYSVPDKYLAPLKLRNVRLMFEARNLGAIIKMNKEGIDPDNPPYSSSRYGALMYVTRYRPEYSIALRIGF